MQKKQYRELFSKSDWDVESLEIIFELIDRKTKEYLNLDLYPNQFEIISSEQLLSMYSSIGLPINYPHWKFGKDYMLNHKKYLQGAMGLSYEMITNTNPCISYNLEDNTLCLMTLVYAHAAMGHNSFFKCNYMFKEWTQADGIVDYMKFARRFIMECEKKYGLDEVEEFLDACHSIQNYGVDNYRHPKLSLDKEKERIMQAIKWEEENHDPVFYSLKEKKIINYENYEEFDDVIQKVLEEPQENILYFLEKYTPKLPIWKREIIRIIRKIAQYFYPQSQTKVANEGWATFCHYYIINRLYDEGFIPESFMLEFIQHHTGVVYQPTFDKKYYYGLNPYTLGFNIFMDIKRICENPTDEDREWFPNLAGKPWLEEMHFAMENFRDDSFILQYLSPKVIRDMKLFAFSDDTDEKFYSISNIHNKEGYIEIRKALAKQYNRHTYTPNILVHSVNEESRDLMLKYEKTDGIDLDEDETDEVLDYIELIWGFPVDIKFL